VTELNLLEYFALAGTQVVKLHAELHRHVKPEAQLQARVEVKITPGALPEEHNTGMPVYQVGARLSCQGFMLSDGDEHPVFTLECVLNAVYQQTLGQSISQETFVKHHTSLTRQLYPLIHHQLMPLLSQFGLHNIKLPHDILHRVEETTEQPQQVH